VVTKTGISGLTLSGGIGWLRRKHGLSCDNLISARVVTASGEVITASETENPEVLWGLRGGGGNLGVVTSLAYRLHPIGPEVFFCFVLYPADAAAEVMRGVQAHLDETGSDFAPLAVLGHVPEADEIPAEAHGRPYVAVLGMHTGPAADGAEATSPLRELAEPLADLSGTMPYTDAQGALDEDYPDGWRYYWKSINVGGLGDEVIAELVRRNAEAPSHHSTIDVWFQGGAMAEVGETETAFANRSAPYLVGIEGNWEDAGTDEENVGWVRETFERMRPHSDGGVYLNFPGFLEEGEELMRGGYGPNYERLAELKAKYDPENLFRLNANVPPAG
jgi:FAD/FMN-containing dehydrogenase